MTFNCFGSWDGTVCLGINCDPETQHSYVSPEKCRCKTCKEITRKIKSLDAVSRTFSVDTLSVSLAEENSTMSHCANIFIGNKGKTAQQRRIDIGFPEPTTDVAILHKHIACCDVFWGKAATADAPGCGVDDACKIDVFWKNCFPTTVQCCQVPLVRLAVAIFAGASSFLGPTLLLDPRNVAGALTAADIALGIAGWLFSSLIKWSTLGKLEAVEGNRGLKIFTYVASFLAALSSLMLTVQGLTRLTSNPWLLGAMGTANFAATFSIGTYSITRIISLFKNISDEHGSLRWGKLIALVVFAILAGFSVAGRVYSTQQFISTSDQIWNAFAYVFGSVFNFPTWALLVVSMMKVFDALMASTEGFLVKPTHFILELGIALLAVLGSFDYAGLIRAALENWEPGISLGRSVLAAIVSGSVRYSASVWSLHKLFWETIAPTCIAWKARCITAQPARTTTPNYGTIEHEPFVSEQPRSETPLAQQSGMLSATPLTTTETEAFVRVAIDYIKPEALIKYYQQANASSRGSPSSSDTDSYDDEVALINRSTTGLLQQRLQSLDLKLQVLFDAIVCPQSLVNVIKEFLNRAKDVVKHYKTLLDATQQPEEKQLYEYELKTLTLVLKSFRIKLGLYKQQIQQGAEHLIITNHQRYLTRSRKTINAFTDVENKIHTLNPHYNIAKFRDLRTQQLTAIQQRMQSLVETEQLLEQQIRDYESQALMPNGDFV